jgi:hypothetical protein
VNNSLAGSKPLAVTFLIQAVISCTRAVSAAYPPVDIEYAASRLEQSRCDLEALGIFLLENEFIESPLLESGDSYVNARMRQESCPNLRCRYV